jgi:hypothetical protein
MLTTEPTIDPRLGEYPFENILRKVHEYMQYELDEKFIKTQIARNIRGESNLASRIIPLAVKKPILRWINRRMGEKTYTLSFSNLGMIKVPENMKKYIRKYEIIPPRGYKTVNATALGYKDHIHILFGSTIKEKTVEAAFFSALRKLNIPVKIQTNTLN